MAIGKRKGLEMTGWLMARANVTGWFTRLVFVLITLLLPLNSVAQSSFAAPISSGAPVMTPFNTVAVNAPVRVCLIGSFGTPCNTAGVILYSDANVQNAIGNPTATNAQGTFSVFINVSQYTLPQLFLVQVTAAPGTTYTYYY